MTLIAEFSSSKMVISSELLPDAQHLTSDAGQRVTFIREQQNEGANKSQRKGDAVSHGVYSKLVPADEIFPLQEVLQTRFKKK